MVWIVRQGSVCIHEQTFTHTLVNMPQTVQTPPVSMKVLNK